jgi:homoserine kinase
VLQREGTLADLEVDPGDDLVVVAFQAELARRGVAAVSGRLTIDSEIPVGRGLGTSAAAAVAGLLLGAAVSGEESPDRTALLSEATRLEGHGDNAAPALLGGLVAVVRREEHEVRALRFPLSADIGFAFAAPEARVATAEARRVLPSQYEKSTTFAALGRLAALLHGLAEGDPEALTMGMQDDLHVPYRLALTPAAAAVFDAAREAGAWAATLSGSGSGVIAACPRDRTEAVVAAIHSTFSAATPGESVAFALEPDRRGALIAGNEPLDPVVAEHEA